MKAKRILSALLAAVMLMSMAMTGIVSSAETELPFSDVDGHWAYGNIKYAYENGLMNGVGDGSRFAPNDKLTRAMVVTVLYRNEGSPITEFKSTFLDVKKDTYYTEAAIWAYENKIVKGTGTNEWGDVYFSPNANITRQELATMFKRYADYKHAKTDLDRADLSGYPDSGKVAENWALDAVQWAVAIGLIEGKTNGGVTTLSPTAQASRAEFATIIKRYCTADFDYDIFYAEPMPLHTYTEPEYDLVKDADFYVAVDGNDNGPGSLEEPFATFERARDAVRELKKTKTTAITVAFKAGNYGSLDNITFTEEDAGTADAPITYCKYGDGDVTFSNGVKIAESEFKPVDKSDYYLLGDVDTSKVYKADLDGIIDEIRSSDRIFSSDSLCYEARIPNKDSFGADTHYGGVTTKNDEESILLQLYLPELVEGFRTTEGMMVTGLLRYGWLTDTFPVKSYDPETDVLTFDFENAEFKNGYHISEVPLAYEERFEDNVFFHNLSDQIDYEGEYWFDPDTKILYIYEPDGDYYIANGGTFMYIAPGAEYLNFVGLDFSTSTENGIEIAANHLTFDRCSVSNIAGEAAMITVFRDGNSDGTLYTTVKGCEFYNFVDKGLYLEASSSRWRELIPSGNVYENNYFHDFGSPEYMSAAIKTRWEIGCLIANNEFVNGSKAAIVTEWSSDVIIEYNVFENLMRSSVDYGVIYNYRQIIERSNKIRYNLFKNTRHFGQVYTIYLDGSWGQEVYGNIFYNSGILAILLNGGRDNSCYDNIIINQRGGNGYGTFVNNWDLNPDDLSEDAYNKAIRDIAGLPKPGEASYQKWYDRWPILYKYTYDAADLGKYECIYTPVNHVKNNHFFGAVLDDEILEKYGDLENNISHEMTEDVGFTCPALGDYTLKDGAAVNNIYFEKIGRY